MPNKTDRSFGENPTNPTGAPLTCGNRCGYWTCTLPAGPHPDHKHRDDQHGHWWEQTRPAPAGRCGNDPNTVLSDGDAQAVTEFREYLRARAAVEAYEAANGPVPPAAAPAPVDRAALCEQIAEAVLHHLARTADIRPGRDGALAFMPEVTDPERLRLADAVLAVLPPPVDRATVLQDFLWRLEQSAGDAAAEKLLDDNPELRRLAAEAPQPETQAGAVEPGTCGHHSSDGHPCNEPSGHLGYHRNARQGGNEWTSWVGDTPVVEDAECCGAEPPLRADGPDSLWGDCWCTLPPGHDGEHHCQPCTERHGAPGWADASREPHPTEADMRHALAVFDRFHGRDTATPAALPGKEG